MFRLVVVVTNIKAHDCIVRSVDWETLGFHVVAAFFNWKEAREYLSHVPVDAVLLTTDLPGNTLFGAVDFVHTEIPDCAIVMVGVPGDDHVRQAAQCCFCDYIPDFADPEELRSGLQAFHSKLGRSKQASGIAEKQNKEHINVAATVAYIDQHILDNICLREVSEHVHISPSQLTRLLKKETGYAYLEYVTKKKMEKAAEFLEKENLKVYEVSEKLGYCSTRYFSRLFYNQYGCYPSKYVAMLNSRQKQSG